MEESSKKYTKVTINGEYLKFWVENKDGSEEVPEGEVIDYYNLNFLALYSNNDPNKQELNGYLFTLHLELNEFKTRNEQILKKIANS